MVSRVACVCLAALLGGAGEAAGATTTRLELGQSFTALEVSSTGQAWVAMRRTDARGAWAVVDGAGRPSWHAMTAADYAFRGQLEPRPDGGMWILRDASTVLRVGADGSTAAIDLRETFDDPSTTSTPDGTFVLTDKIGGLARVSGDGAVSQGDFTLPPGPFELLDCEPADVAATPDGRLVVADYGCGRLVTRRPDGKVTARELEPGVLNPYALLARADGSVWFSAENGVGGTIGRVSADGTITRFDVPRPPGELAEAPDGSVWAADETSCQVYRVADDRVQRRPAPFTTNALRFTPDGGMWLMGHTRLEHLSAAEVAAATPPARCDLTGPRVTLPDRRASRLSVRTLRRRGLRLRANEDGHLRVAIQPSGGGTPRLVDRVLRRGKTLKLRLPSGWLRRPGASLSIDGTITDADGNFGDLPRTIRLGP